MTVGLADERPARTQTIAHFLKIIYFFFSLVFLLFCFSPNNRRWEGKIYNDTARHTVHTHTHTATIVDVTHKHKEGTRRVKVSLSVVCLCLWSTRR